MIFHENRLLADGSHEINLKFFPKLGKMSQNLLCAVVVIGALMVKTKSTVVTFLYFLVEFGNGAAYGCWLLLCKYDWAI